MTRANITATRTDVRIEVEGPEANVRVSIPEWAKLIAGTCDRTPEQVYAFLIGAVVDTEALTAAELGRDEACAIALELAVREEPLRGKVRELVIAHIMRVGGLTEVTEQLPEVTLK